MASATASGRGSSSKAPRIWRSNASRENGFCSTGASCRISSYHTPHRGPRWSAPGRSIPRAALRGRHPADSSAGPSHAVLALLPLDSNSCRQRRRQRIKPSLMGRHAARSAPQGRAVSLAHAGTDDRQRAGGSRARTQAPLAPASWPAAISAGPSTSGRAWRLCCPSRLAFRASVAPRLAAIEGARGTGGLMHLTFTDVFGDIMAVIASAIW